MATRALANLSPEGYKLAKRPRGHVITGLLQIAGTVYAQTSFAVESIHRMNETDVTIEISERLFREMEE